jgi:N-acetylglucosaminyl-diphospho-decaprenol L-rhamnosyltransferase
LAASSAIYSVSDPTSSAPQGSGASITAVVVNYNAGSALCDCVASLEAGGVGETVVVDNASVDDSMELLARRSPRARPIRSVRNLGYGRGANVGARATTGEYLLVCNPDLVAGPEAVRRLATVLDDSPKVALVGPMLRERSGAVYPSGREFPGMAEAVGHGFVGLFWGGNPWTLRYRRIGQEQHRARDADWVSGAFFLVRRDAFDEIGGFDERYFMYVEDVDLCWRLRKAGWTIRYEPGAEVVHQQGLSTSRHPYRMLVAHHRSIWRFARQTASGRERALLPIVALGLGTRLLLAWAEHFVSPRSRLRARPG